MLQQIAVSLRPTSAHTEQNVSDCALSTAISCAVLMPTHGHGLVHVDEGMGEKEIDNSGVALVGCNAERSRTILGHGNRDMGFWSGDEGTCQQRIV